MVETSDPFREALLSLSGKAADDFTLIVDGLEIPVMAGKLIRRVDTAAAGWSATIAYDEIDADLAKVLIPYKYPYASVYLGGKLMCAGRLYSVAPSLRGERICELEGASFTADIIDSTTTPPYEQRNVTLEKRAKSLVDEFSIRVIYDAPDAPFKRVAIKPMEKIFEHLSRLAFQRGVLITSTVTGDLKFTKAIKNGKPVGTIEEGKTPVESLTAKFNGRERFSIYKVVFTTPGVRHKRHGPVKLKTAHDDNINLIRRTTVKSHDIEGGETRDAAEWYRSKQLAKALTIHVPVSSWYGPDGKLWQENTLLTLKSPTIFVPNGYDFLIRKVEFLFEEKGTGAVLELVPPQEFTGEPIDEPWATDSNRKTNYIDRIVRRVP